MSIAFHRTFEKRYRKAPANIRRQFDARLRLFASDSFHPILGNHPLAGDRKGQRTFNVSGDWRAVYAWRDKDAVVFLDLDTHSNLYE